MGPLGVGSAHEGPREATLIVLAPKMRDKVRVKNQAPAGRE
nr:MAG TPA: hypothetical protein [Caudoviricetes sp.]